MKKGLPRSSICEAAVRLVNTEGQNNRGMDIQRSFSFPYRRLLVLFKKISPVLLPLKSTLQFFPRVRADMGLKGGVT